MTTTAATTDPPLCRYQWRADGITHHCWEPPGHVGDHVCRLGNCREQPTTTPQEASS